MSNPETKQKSSRRQFLKATGLAGAILGHGQRCTILMQRIVVAMCLKEI